MTPPPVESLTRYIILTTDTAALTFTRVGAQDARGSDEALRKFFADPLADNDGFYVAVSENHFKLREVAAKVRTTLADRVLPPVATPATGPEQGTLT